VPGKWWGLGYVCCAPVGFILLVLFAVLRDWRFFPGQLVVVGMVVMTGVILYSARRGAANRVIASVERCDGSLGAAANLEQGEAEEFGI